MARLLGMGNALLDIMTQLDNDDYLPVFGLPKGSMTLVDAIMSKALYDGTGHLQRTIRSGGSAANTIPGAARLGVPSAFMGKIGRHGSLVRQHGKTHQIGIIPANSIDTTGAGDLYASGFLYGMIRGLPADKCGRIGAILAGKVIEVMGPKIPDGDWQKVKDQVTAEMQG